MRQLKCYTFVHYFSIKIDVIEFRLLEQYFQINVFLQSSQTNNFVH